MQLPLPHNVASAATALNALTSLLTPSIPSPACSTGASSLPPGLTPGGPSVNLTFNASPAAGGSHNPRRYLVHLPPTFSPTNTIPAPLILTFHGLTQTTSSIEYMSGFSDPLLNRHAIAVYPEGINNGFTGDPASPPKREIDDVKFVAEMLDKLAGTVCFDMARVYATGFSNGGGLVGLLACDEDMAGRIAAFSGSAAAYYTDEALGESLFMNCDKKNAPKGKRRRDVIPFLEFHGDADHIIKYDGRNQPDPDTYAITDYFAMWARRNGCDDKKEGNMTQILDGGYMTRYSWSCSGWSDVLVQYLVKGFGHGWPSTVQLPPIYEEYRHGPTRFNGTKILMDWFLRWSLPVVGGKDEL